MNGLKRLLAWALRPQVGIGAVSLVIVLSVAVVDARRTSPGPLSGVHGGIPELAGRAGCSDCHGGWGTSMTDSCLECHEAIRTHMVLDIGLHGGMPEVEAEQCGRCHSDHHGEGFSLVNRLSFREAGFGDASEFEHATIGWEMDGAHTELACSECHTNADIGLLPAGEHRYLGLSRDCGTCHEDSHEGRMQLDCAQCHGQSDFTELRSDGHERFLDLIGGHAEVSCRTCHAEDSEHSLESVGANGVDPERGRACTACHESPHKSEFLDGVAAQTWLSTDAGCVTCHASEHESFRDEDLTVTPALHAASGFTLSIPHSDATCEDCHGAPDLAFHERYLARDADTCSACHADPHDGQFAEGPFSDNDCLACHERSHFEPHSFDVEDHGLAALKLDGAHLELDCQACHEQPGVQRPRIFRGTPSDCDGCHGDAHASFFAPHAKLLDAVPHGMCASCHGTTAFDDELDAFDHGVHAGFELAGAHEQASCEACHPRAATPDTLGRSFGRIEDHFGTVDGCASCHDDPHGGEFDKPGLPREIEGRADCARCHTTSSFRALQVGWDHRRWTGFGLAGAHEEADCAACHAPRLTPDSKGRTWDAARGDRCADCHDDPHARQFEVRDTTSCERCHESAESWSTLDFRHDLDARFELGASHAEVACSACHRPDDAGGSMSTLPEGAALLPKGVVRYRPMEKGCVTCHGTLDGPTIKRRER